MWRAAFFPVLSIFVLQAAQAQQNPPRGVPASVTSPSVSPTGAVILHGVPASVTSPRATQGSGTLSRGVPAGVNGAGVLLPNGRFRRFGNPHERRAQRDFIVPIFYPLYGYGYGPDYSTNSPADPSASDPSAGNPDPPAGSMPVASGDGDALRDAYNRGAQDALAAEQQAGNRYGEHFFDSREKAQPRAPLTAERAPEQIAGDDPPAKDDEDNAPPTIFVFKDGHKLETQNFAIVGQTVFDFSTKPLKKIPLPELDMDATRKANDDRGIVLRLP